MTTNNDHLATEPQDHPAKFMAAFNSGDAALVDSLYEPDAILIEVPGKPVTGSQRFAVNAGFMALGIPIEETVRNIYVTGDVALVLVDWKLEGTSVNGDEIDFSGSAVDVIRKGTDGYWRFVVDNPWGTGDA